MNEHIDVLRAAVDAARRKYRIANRRDIEVALSTGGIHAAELECYAEQCRKKLQKAEDALDVAITTARRL